MLKSTVSLRGGQSPTWQSKNLALWLWIASLTLAMTNSTYAQSVPPECRFVTQHKSTADVAYQAGVDVNGKAVVPADLNAARFAVPDVIRVPLSVDLIERVRDMPGQFEGVEAIADFGLLEIHKDGAVYFNGQRWDEPFYAACGVVRDDGQAMPDAVQSAPETQNYNEVNELADEPTSPTAE